MKENTDFWAPLLGIDIATKPRGQMKYLDWDRVWMYIKQYPHSTISVGLCEDWNNTGGCIWADGDFESEYVYDHSTWATPIIDIDGEEIECWTYEDVRNKRLWWVK